MATHTTETKPPFFRVRSFTPLLPKGNRTSSLQWRSRGCKTGVLRFSSALRHPIFQVNSPNPTRSYRGRHLPRIVGLYYFLLPNLILPPWGRNLVRKPLFRKIFRLGSVLIFRLIPSSFSRRPLSRCLPPRRPPANFS